MDPEIHITRNFLTEDQCLELILNYRGKLYDSSLRNGRKNKNVRDSKTYLFRNNIELCKLFQHRRMQFQFTEYNPNIVINLAAQAGVRYSIENPMSYVESNIVGFLNIL